MLRSRLASLHEVKATGTARDMRDEMLSAGHSQKPTVSTALGAEGLDFVDGKEIMLADEPKAFAGAVADLLSDASRRRVLQSKIPGIPMTIPPNAIEVHSYISTRCDEHKTVPYFGAMDYHANQDAVELFVLRILLELGRLGPDVKFVAAECNPPDRLRRRFPGIAGSVQDMRAEIAEAGACVVPLRLGSGPRLEILQASALATPIVSTRVGPKGWILWTGGKSSLPTSPKHFARAVADLLAGPSRRKALGEAARRRAELQYRLPVLRAALRVGLKNVVDRPRELYREFIAHGLPL